MSNDIFDMVKMHQETIENLRRAFSRDREPGEDLEELAFGASDPEEWDEESHMTVPEMLEAAAATYRERNKLYGDNYKLHGCVMAQLFGREIVLRTPDDHNRFGVLTQIVSKLTRYVANWEEGGHDDSLLDVSVYSNMLRELDDEIRNPPEVPF